mgnify:CR=1 FL=1
MKKSSGAALARFNAAADSLQDDIDGVLKESAAAAARSREITARVFGTLAEEEAMLDLEMDEIDFELRYHRRRAKKTVDSNAAAGASLAAGAVDSPANDADASSASAAASAAAAATGPLAMGSAEDELAKLLGSIPGLGPAPTLEELTAESKQEMKNMAHLQSVLDESLAMVGATRAQVRKTARKAGGGGGGGSSDPTGAAARHAALSPETVEFEVLDSPALGVSLPQIGAAVEPEPTTVAPTTSSASTLQLPKA